jgi:hypothetical protein
MASGVAPSSIARATAVVVDEGVATVGGEESPQLNNQATELKNKGRGKTAI